MRESPVTTSFSHSQRRDGQSRDDEQGFDSVHLGGPDDLLVNS